MPGKLCDPYSENPPKLSRAYCEGRHAAAAGELVGTNPHADGTPEATAWSTGYATWINDPALGSGRDCCADPFGGGYTAP